MKPIRIALLLAASLFATCNFALAAVEGTFDKTLQVNGPVNLEVTTGSGNIEIHTGVSSQIHVIGHIRASEWFDDHSQERVDRIKANPPIQQSGNDVRIGHIDDPDLRRNISISYEVTVPADCRLVSHTGSGNQIVQGVQGTADINTGSGNIQVSDVGGTVRASTGSGNVTVTHSKGTVRAKTGSGSIHATDVDGGFEGDTGSGSVALEQSGSGSVRVSTGSGGLDLRGVRGSLEAKAGSGNIRADGTPTGAWSLHSGSGGIHLRLPSDQAFDLDAHTSSGSISVNHPLTVQGAIGKKDVRGRVRGGGVSVAVETGSGNIAID